MTDLDLRIQEICDSRIERLFTSPLHKTLFAAIIICAGFIFVSISNDLKEATKSINNLEKSIAILNTSLVVIDERTRENERSIRENYKNKKK